MPRSRRNANQPQPSHLKLWIALGSIPIILVGVVLAVKLWPRPDHQGTETTESRPQERPVQVSLPQVATLPKDPPRGFTLSSVATRRGQSINCEIAPGVVTEFCWIPPGSAQLGASKAEQVALARTMPGGRRQVWMDAESEQFRPDYKSVGFWLGKYEVTQAEWTALMGTNPSMFNGQDANKARGLDTSRFPVENVSWNDCQDFIKKLNEGAEHISAALGTGVQFALPNEDEWEYACRGGKGNGQPFHFGRVLNGKQANCDGSKPWGSTTKGPKLARTAAVGSYAKDGPHPWGLCDMHGNVEEWCENEYGAGEVTRVIRGGNWDVLPWGCRSANRYRADPTTKSGRCGFRVCLRPMSESSIPNQPSSIVEGPGPRPETTTIRLGKASSAQTDAIALAVNVVVTAAEALRAAMASELDGLLKSSKAASEVDRQDAAKKLAVFLTANDEKLRRTAAQGLAEMGGDAEQARMALQAATQDEDVVVRRAARRALEKLDQVIAARELAKIRAEIALLAKELKAKEPEKRIKALEQIAAYGPKANEVIGEQLIEAMDDKVPAVQLAASETLEKVNPKVQPLLFTIRHGMDKFSAIKRLGDLGPEAAITVPLLLYCNKHPAAFGSRVYEDLFPVIARIAPKDKRFAAAVLSSIAAPNPRGNSELQMRRIAGIAQLRVIDAEAADKVKALVTAMGDGQQLIYVIETLEGFGKDAAPALPLLKKLKQSPNDVLRNAAIKAISKIE